MLLLIIISYFCCVCVIICVVCHSAVHMLKSEDNLTELGLSFHCRFQDSNSSHQVWVASAFTFWAILPTLEHLLTQIPCDY